MILELDMHDKTSRQILMIKQEYGIADNDPVFALLDVYGSMLQDLNSALHSVKEAQSIAYKSLNEIKEEKYTLKNFLEDHKVQIAEEGVKIGTLLTEDMNQKLRELFKSIDEYRKGIENERKLLSNDRASHHSNLKTVFIQYNEDKDAQKTKNNIAFSLISLMMLLQGASIVMLLNFIR